MAIYDKESEILQLGSRYERRVTHLGVRNPMPPDQGALRHAAVFLLVFIDLHRGVFEVKQDFTPPNAMILERGLVDSLLEICIELQYQS